MGAENSRPEKERQRDDYINRIHTERAIQEALTRQRQIFEEKCEMLLQAQSTSTLATQNTYNSVPPQRPVSTSNTLYPNIQKANVIENNQFIQEHHQHPSANLCEFRFSPPVPSAPVPSAPVQSSPGDYEENNQLNRNRGAIPKTLTKKKQPSNNNNQNFSCVSCSGTYGMQIYQCLNGHSSCQNCKLGTRPCGICSNPITNMRNITLEQLVADMVIKENDNQGRIKCPNAKDGCCLSFTKGALTDHLKECPYMDLTCPLSQAFGICKWKGKVNHLSSHFKDTHEEHCIAEVGKEMTLIVTNTELLIVYFIQIGSFNFLFYIKQDKDLTLCMTTQLFGTAVSASKWTYEVQIYNKKEPRRKFTYTDICKSFSVPVKDIFSEGECANIQRQYASTYFYNNELTYQIFLKKTPDNRRKPQNIK